MGLRFFRSPGNFGSWHAGIIVGFCKLMSCQAQSKANVMIGITCKVPSSGGQLNSDNAQLTFWSLCSCLDCRNLRLGLSTASVASCP